MNDLPMAQQLPPSFNAPMVQQQFAPQQSSLTTMQGNQYGTQQSQQLQQPAVNPMPMSTQAPQQQQQPQQSSPEQPAPPSAPNMFKMQKGRSK